MNSKLFLSFAVVILLIINPFKSKAQQSDSTRMDWFSDAKLGIFIHWGIYSVQGSGESWPFHNKRMTHEAYMKQIGGFTAKNYNAKEWVDLIKYSGAQYAVITSKHHDGVALYNTKMNDLSIPKKAPAKKDVLTPFVNELRNQNLKVGLYYSLIDWTYPDYPGFLRDSSRYDSKKDTIRWNRFLKFCHGQIGELSTQYNPDLFWFDGDWEHSAEEWHASEIRTNILKHNPKAIINGRLQGFGDYDTPEQNFPVVRPNMKNWELCMTINDSWGWEVGDTNWKTPYQIITIFADAIGMGGTLLLDIGPKEDGSIPAEQVNVLKELGNWTHKHQEAIFGSLGGMPQGHFYGPSTLSKDSTTLYLFLSGNPQQDVIVKGLVDNIQEISVVGSGTNLKWDIVGKISWSHVPGLVYIHVPENEQDKYMTVLKVKLKSPIRLYRGKGGFQ